MSALLEGELAKAALVLEGAKAPSILLGPDARPAANVLVDLADRLGAAVLTTPDAKSSFDETHPLSVGVFSFGASDAASAVAEATDVVLAVGTNLGEFATGGGRAFERAAIVHMTDDPLDLAIAPRAAVSVVGDVAAHIRWLAAAIRPAAAPTPWFEHLRAGDPSSAVENALPHKGRMDPGEAARVLARVLPAGARVACDVTSAALHVLHKMRFADGQRLWLQVERSACMGSALGTGLGVRLASGQPTLVIIGDWGLMMGGSELHTVASLQIDRFVVVVWSNDGGALIRAGVRAQGLQLPPEVHSWSGPRFADVARGYGLRAMTVRTARALGRAAAVALSAPFPVLIDASIEPEAPIPGATARFVHLEASAGRT